MKRELHALIQGEQEWYAFRASHDGASEASAMLGISPYKTRQELLREKATGITQEVSPQLQSIFDKGHATEIGGRAMAEKIINDELYPVTYSYGRMSASSDGLTMDGSTAFEHKQWSQSLAESIRADALPDYHQPQCQQVMHVTGAEKMLFMCSDGTEQNCEWMWVYPDPDWVAKLDLGWAQFSEDLAAYKHVETKPETIGRAPDQLPALRIEVTGMVTASNLAEFKQTALSVFRGINTNLQTDQDFADAEKAVKFCKDAEERLDAAKSHALSQTASIDDLFKTIDAIKDEARTVRLKLDKLVKAEKDNRKTEIVSNAKAELSEHVMALHKRVGGPWIPMADYSVFVDAIKGLKSIDSMRDKVGAALANAKIDASAIADRVQANLSTLEEHKEYRPLFPDLDRIIAKPATDFSDTVNARIAAHKAEQEAMIARVRAEEEARARAKVEAEAQAKAEAERLAAIEKDRAEQAELAAKARAEADARLAEAIIAKQPNTTPEGEPAMPAGAVTAVAAQPAPAAANEPRILVDNVAAIKLGEINARLGFTVTADFLASLNFRPARTEGNAKLYLEVDFPAMCSALGRHIANVASIRREA